MALEHGLERSRVLAIHLGHLLDVEVLRLTHRLIRGVEAPDLVPKRGMGGRASLGLRLDPLLSSARFAIEDGIGRHRVPRPCTLRLGEYFGLGLFGSGKANEDHELVGRLVADFSDGGKASLQEDLPAFVDRRRGLALAPERENGMQELGNPFGQSGILRAGLQSDEGREQLRKRHDGPPIRPGADSP